MKLSLHRADEFNTDFDQQYRWYLSEADEEVAERFFEALENTLQILLTQPELGHRRKFRRSALSNLRSFRVEPPFDKLLIFYRYNDAELSAERLMHGSRDLPRRLAEPPGR
jgi:toxin ParE1/3/4